ncbi:8194_t:CDS:2 [Entrophospora sp. SA101]|nr:8194_t:CDS:2 [Entrophospora sp. SA101]
MSADLQTKIYNFLINAEENHITATSVIYQGIENEPWISKMNYDQSDNIEKLKGKLNRDTSPLYQHLYSSVNEIHVEELSWEDPLASQKIARNMVPNPRPIVQEIYIAHVVKEILNVLKDVWNNPAFNSNLARSLNEGTYQSTVIAVLKNLPTENSFFVSTSEKQSIASVNRKGGNKGRHPDIMFLGNYLETIFELINNSSTKKVHLGIELTTEQMQKDEINFEGLNKPEIIKLLGSVGGYSYLMKTSFWTSSKEVVRLRINSNMTATDLWMKGLEILEDELLTNSDENESLDRDSSNINIMDKKENELDMKVR